VSKYHGKSEEKKERLLKLQETPAFSEAYPSLELLQGANGEWGFYEHGISYLPLAIIEIPLQNLIELTLELANELAQPAQENWDGTTITELLNAA
jgi:hypothetical protein